MLARRRINSGTHGEALLRTRRIGAVRATLRQELRIPQGFLRVLSFVKLNTLEKVYLCLRDLTPEITLSDELSQQALLRIERMMAIG